MNLSPRGDFNAIFGNRFDAVTVITFPERLVLDFQGFWIGIERARQARLSQSTLFDHRRFPLAAQLLHQTPGVT
jgi:hypothetical protein